MWQPKMMLGSVPICLQSFLWSYSTYTAQQQPVNWQTLHVSWQHLIELPSLKALAVILGFLSSISFDCIEWVPKNGILIKGLDGLEYQDEDCVHHADSRKESRDEWEPREVAKRLADIDYDFLRLHCWAREGAGDWGQGMVLCWSSECCAGIIYSSASVESSHHGCDGVWSGFGISDSDWSRIDGSCLSLEYIESPPSWLLSLYSVFSMSESELLCESLSSSSFSP